MKQTKFKIYKAENTLNGYVYIGATSKTVEERKKDHECKAKNNTGYEFQQAISTYGAEAFEWEEIDTASSPNELAQKEKEYIVEYNAQEEGYNKDSGGSIQKCVYQYNLKNGLLVNTLNSLQNASNAINVTKQFLSRICLGANNTYNGFYWSYTFKEPFIPQKDSRTKLVVQYDLKGNELQRFESISIANTSTNINKTCIAKVCRGERVSAGGFNWKYI